MFNILFIFTVNETILETNFRHGVTLNNKYCALTNYCKCGSARGYNTFSCKYKKKYSLQTKLSQQLTSY